MPLPMLRLLQVLIWTALTLSALQVCAHQADARTLSARIARVKTAAATAQDVRVQLHWPSLSAEGELLVQAGQVESPDLGYRFRDLAWRCPLRRDGKGGWQCAGDVRSGRAAPLRLSLQLGVASTEVRLSRGAAALDVHRSAAAPDATRIDLTRVPLAWLQALAAQAWPAGRIKAGTLDGRLTVTAPAQAPLRIAGPLVLKGAALDTPDGAIAAEGVGAGLQIETALGETRSLRLQGHLAGGELLFGNAYVSLQQRAVELGIDAEQRKGEGWRLPRLSWRDNGILAIDGSAALTAEANLRALDIQARSANLTPLRDAYLSGWLGLAGLGQLKMSGAADARVRFADGVLHRAEGRLHEVAFDDPQGRFRFDRLDGSVSYSADAPVASELAWAGGALYGLAFGAARLPFDSRDGELRLSRAVTFPMLGGRVGLDGLRLRPPEGERGLDIRFGLSLDTLDVGQLAKALDWPAFTGELSGHLPEAHYANDRLDLEGGLTMQLFGGSVTVSSLAMERPFGVAPTLSSNLVLERVDLESLTGVFGFGSITGKLYGRVDALRLVDWQPVAFDAEFHTRKARGVRQRISQRAVQDLSSVGDATFMSSLQSRLIGFFDDFGYDRIGLSCKLADEVCTMGGLGSAGQGFTIVEGSGVPRLSVVGYHRRVDWPTLLERLEAVSKGDLKPVVQ